MLCTHILLAFGNIYFGKLFQQELHAIFDKYRRHYVKYGWIYSHHKTIPQLSMMLSITRLKNLWYFLIKIHHIMWWLKDKLIFEVFDLLNTISINYMIFNIKWKERTQRHQKNGQLMLQGCKSWAIDIRY